MCQDQEQEIEQRFQKRMAYLGEVPDVQAEGVEIPANDRNEYGWFA